MYSTFNLVEVVLFKPELAHHFESLNREWMAQGRGYGDLLISSVINFAKEAGAERLILVSNTQLKPAIALYEKHGFKSVPITDAEDYKRVDIQMQLKFD